MFGNAAQQSITQAAAYRAYHWIAVWVLLFACVKSGPPGETVAIAIVAVDIIVGGTAQVINIKFLEASREEWRYVLTNRLFYKLFWLTLHEEGPSRIDVDVLFKQATKDALADIKDVETDHFLGIPGRGARWAKGILTFLWLIFSSVVWYGSAFFLGGAR